MRALLFHSKLSHLSKKHCWMIIWPISLPLHLERMWAMSRGTICSGPFYIGYKKWSLSQTTTLFFVKTNWLLSFGSERLRALDFLGIDKKQKVVKKRPKKTHTCSLDENSIKILCTEWWEWLNTIGSYFLHWNFEKKRSLVGFFIWVKKNRKSTESNVIFPNELEMLLRYEPFFFIKKKNRYYFYNHTEFYCYGRVEICYPYVMFYK